MGSCISPEYNAFMIFGFMTMLSCILIKSTLGIEAECVRASSLGRDELVGGCLHYQYCFVMVVNGIQA